MGGVMKSKLLAVLWIAIFMTCIISAASAGPREDAVALVEKAAAYVKANGLPKAYEGLNDPKGQFVKGDLYVFVWDYNGIVKAHPVTKGLVNKNMSTTKNAEGKEFVKEIIAFARSKGKGWVDYTWTHAASDTIAIKSSYVLNMPEYKIVLGCGTYQ
jgi:cytochrome c